MTFKMASRGKVSSPSLFHKTPAFLLFQFCGVVAINVALRKSGTCCNKKSASDLLFDGDKMRAISMYENCLSQFFLDINLAGFFVINYVVVYAGKDKLPDLELEKLNYLIVYTLRPDFLTSCSQYPNRAVGDQGLRINCLNVMQKFWSIKVHSLKNDGLTASEIEVHSFDNLNNSLIYYGCFDKEFEEKINGSIARCLEYCSLKLFIFAGLKGKECGCSNDMKLETELQTSNCSVKCDNRFSRCGGNDSYSVYLAAIPLPAYFGCIELEKVVDNRTIQGNMTIIKCLYFCEHHFYAVLWKGDYCFCQNIFPSERDPVYYDNIGVCNMSCTGDPNTKCGGIDYVSIYTTCSKTSYRLLRSSTSVQMCSQLFHCTGPYDINGECHGGCNASFHGVHCFERDADTCGLQPCDEKSSTCRNVIGTYVCDCLSGFYRGESGECIERFPYWKLILIIALPILIAISSGLSYLWYVRNKTTVKN